MSKLLDQHENLMDEWMSEHGIATERAQMKARIAELEVALTTARREGAEAMRERLLPFLREAITENVRSDYNTGIIQNGKWMDGALSDAERLQSELGLEPGWHDDQMIRSRLDEVVEARLRAIPLENEPGDAS